MHLTNDFAGADSGIGRAIAVAYAKEGADVACAYLCVSGEHFLDPHDSFPH